MLQQCTLHVRISNRRQTQTSRGGKQPNNQPVAESSLTVHTFVQVAFTLAPFLSYIGVSHSSPGYVAVSQELGQSQNKTSLEI